MEELYESNVMLADDHIIHPISDASSASRRITPVDIPAARSPWTDERDGDDHCVADGRMEMLEPPHVLVSRIRREGKVAFSLCSGLGRTLKGRDLCRVRDSVLRMTGFLEG